MIQDRLEYMSVNHPEKYKHFLDKTAGVRLCKYSYSHKPSPIRTVMGQVVFKESDRCSCGSFHS